MYGRLQKYLIKILVLDNWKFKAQTKNILDIDYKRPVYETIKNNGQIEELKDVLILL